MKIIISFLIIIPVIITAYYQDTDIADMNISFDEYPFYLNYYYADHLSIFDGIDYKSPEVFYPDRLFTRTFFYDNYSVFIEDESIKKIYSIKPILNELNYGIGIINSSVRNRIYGSLFFADSQNTVHANTLVSLIKDNPYAYRNTINFMHRNAIIRADIDNDHYSLQGGFQNDKIYLIAGMDNDKVVSIKWNMELLNTNFGKTEYNSNDNSTEELIYASYPIRIGRSLIVPRIIYSDSLLINLGYSYRILPQMTLISSYSGLNNHSFNAGIRYDEKHILFNSIVKYMYPEKRTEYFMSGVLHGDNFLFSLDMSYDSLPTYCTSFYFVYPFYDGNLKPGLFCEYNSNQELYIAAVIELIETEIYAGTVLYLDKREYLIKGGFTWYFSAHSY